jgi:pimeloyl-ACP methyl ester carboxylesterase
MTKFPEIIHERVDADGVTLHVARAGEGPPVVLLHGFPENWRSWQRQIPELVRAGFSVLAPDMRGYPESDILPSREAYRLTYLIADVAALARATGHARVCLVGHDWGGVVAWTFAREHPELLEKLVIVNAPHPQLYFEKVRRPPQMFRSWYVLFFLLPWLPEVALSAGHYRAVRDLFRRRPSLPAFTDQDIDQYIEGLSRPGALTAALNYYRANVRLGLRQEWRATRIETNTCVIWGERDPALGTELLDGLEHYVPRVKVHRMPQVSHWVQNEAPEEFNRMLIQYLCSDQ